MLFVEYSVVFPVGASFSDAQVAGRFFFLGKGSGYGFDEITLSY